MRVDYKGEVGRAAFEVMGFRCYGWVEIAAIEGADPADEVKDGLLSVLCHVVEDAVRGAELEARINVV